MTVFGEDKLGWVRWGFLLVLQSLFLSVLTGPDAIFCWEIKEGRCKWVKERQNAEKPLFSLPALLRKPITQKNIYSVRRTWWCNEWFYCPDLSGGGQQVDGGQQHPATTRLLTLVHLQELDDGSTGCLCLEEQTHTHERTVVWMESDSSVWRADGLLLEQWSVIMQRINHLCDCDMCLVSTAHFFLYILGCYQHMS